MSALDEAVEAAVAHHRAGRLDDAEVGYGQVLAADPDNLRALYNLGLLLTRRKATDQALPLLAKAYGAAPPGFPAWVGYAQALIAAERFAEAEDVLGRGSGAQADALQVRLRQAWGMALMRGGQDADAEAQFRQACELAPDDADAHADLGLIEMRLGRLEAAVKTFDTALELAPRNVTALVNLGSALRGLGRPEAAEAAYRKALAIDPGHPLAARNLGGLLIEQERYEEALEGADAGLKFATTADLLMARGDALFKLGRWADALACFGAALQAGPSYEGLTRMALTQATMRRHVDAIETLNRAIALNGMAPLAFYRRSFLRLLLRDFAGGWRDYETRMRCDEFVADAGVITPEVRATLTLDATPAAVQGQRVLLVAEQGIGDQVMFASAIPDLARDATAVTAAVDKRLVRLFSNSFPGVGLLGVPGASAMLSDYDRVLAMGSLGRLYRNQAEDFPGEAYLRPRAEVREAWLQRLGPPPRGLRIGLSWRGGSPKTGGQRRSVTLAQLAPVLGLPDCQFVSLQYGDVETELAAVNAGLGTEIRVFPSEEIDDFEDLAGLVQTLDLVVSVQTAVVHLCGAIGQECLTLVPHNPEWRYTLAGSTMPWYRSVRIFRQEEAGAWDPVIQSVADVLRDRAT